MSRGDKDYTELHRSFSEGTALRERYWQDVLAKVRRRRRSYRDEDHLELSKALGIPPDQTRRALRQVLQEELSSFSSSREGVVNAGG